MKSRRFTIAAELSVALCGVMLVVSLIGALHPQLVKFARTGHSPNWFQWTGTGIGFGHVSYVDSSTGIVVFTARSVRINSLMLAFIFAFLPVLWLVDFTKRRKVPSDHRVCASCGYDLRASRDRCPECGLPRRREGRRNREEKI